MKLDCLKPVTYTDRTLMPFGKHKGTALEEVPAQYLLWFFEQDDAARTRPELYDYIEENFEEIQERAFCEGEAENDEQGFDGNYGYDKDW